MVTREQFFYFYFSLILRKNRWKLLRRVFWNSRVPLKLVVDQRGAGLNVLSLNPITCFSLGILDSQLVKIAMTSTLESGESASVERIMKAVMDSSVRPASVRIGRCDVFNCFGSDAIQSISVDNITPTYKLHSLPVPIAEDAKLSLIRQFSAPKNIRLEKHHLEQILNTRNVFYKNDIVRLTDYNVYTDKTTFLYYKVDVSSSPCILDASTSVYESSATSFFVPFSNFLLRNPLTRSMHSTAHRMSQIYFAQKRISRKALVLLVTGASGSGKRLLSRVLAARTHRTFYEVDGYEMVGENPAASEAKWSSWWEKAKLLQNCVLFVRNAHVLAIDQFNALDRRILQYMEQKLSESSKATVIFSCTTDMMSSMSASVKSLALYTFSADYMDETERKSWLAYFLEEKLAGHVAKKTSGFSLAELQELVYEEAIEKEMRILPMRLEPRRYQMCDGVMSAVGGDEADERRESAKSVERAKQASPCVIFFDEIDSLAPNRGRNGDSGGVIDRIVSQLLAELDKLHNSPLTKVFVMGATNRPDLLDNSLMAPGRFDKLVEVKPGEDVESKTKILEAVSRKMKFEDDVDLRDIASRVDEKMSGAQLFSIISNAGMAAIVETIQELEDGRSERQTMSVDTNSTTFFDDDMDDDTPVKSKRIIKFWMILAAISVIGIVLNLGLLLRRKFSTNRSSSTTRSSVFLLGTMAIADTMCLFSLLFLLCLRFFALHPYVLTFVCKLSVFVMHTTSSFSIWCWLVLSAVRYVAVYRPYTHLKLNKEPRLAVLTVAIFCCVSEVWVLWDIGYDDTFKSCGGTETEISRHLQIFEIFSSYFLPVIMITVLDLKVILCRTWRFSHGPKRSVKAVKQKLSVYSEGCPSPESSMKKYSTATVTISKSRSNGELTTSSSSRSKRRQHLRVLRRCLCITVFDLSMNLPSYLLRLYLSLSVSENIDFSTIVIVEEISQIMYFAQFALNALYLICIIYDAPKRKFTLPSTQLSAVGLTPRASRKSQRSTFETRLV
ncbi:unnamed protein product [Caenorhabditis sp. 36 PRJEB53466]|nr:unnamed protein product [Caenorhabditis sp. 36 PRJEB53466]